MISQLFAKRLTCLFIDKVNGKPVNLYLRKDGTKFMAHSRFDSLFFKIEYNESNS